MYKLLVDNSGKDVWEDFSVNSTDGFEVDDFNAWPLLKTDILSSGKTYNALVEDVYEDGKEHLMTASMFVAKEGLEQVANASYTAKQGKLKMGQINTSDHEQCVEREVGIFIGKKKKTDFDFFYIKI